MASSSMQRTVELTEPPDDVSHSKRHAGHQRRPRQSLGGPRSRAVLGPVDRCNSAPSADGARVCVPCL